MEASAAAVLAEEAIAGVLGGEYEGWISGVAESLASGARPLAPGWTERGANGPLTERPAIAIADIDALPPPAHDELLAGGYTVAYPVQRRTRLRCAYVLSTRGCPHACTFCSPVEMRSRFLPYRVRNVDAVVDELAQVAALGANVVYFNDDNFLRERDRVAALCEGILRRGLDISWLADARVDDVDPALLPLMRRAGCSTLCLGVESGSQRVLDALRKGITVEQTRAAADAIRRAGIWMVAYVILGSPGETDAERQATWRLLDDIRPELVQCHRFAWYPMARGERGDPNWPHLGDKFASDSTGQHAARVRSARPLPQVLPVAPLPDRLRAHAWAVAARSDPARRGTGPPYRRLHGQSEMSRGAGAALVAVSAVYLILIVALAARAGANYEEVVPYVLSRLDIRGPAPDADPAEDGAAAPRFVTSSYASQARVRADRGAAPAAAQPALHDRPPLLWRRRARRAAGSIVYGRRGCGTLAFGVVALWLLYDVAGLLGLGPRAALLAVAIAATSLQFTLLLQRRRGSTRACPRSAPSPCCGRPCTIRATDAGAGCGWA